MFPLGISHRWMLMLIKITFLFYGMFLKNITCKSMCYQNKILDYTVPDRCDFPSKELKSGIKFCSNEGTSHSGFFSPELIACLCCCTGEDSKIEINDLGSDQYSIVVEASTFSNQDTVLMPSPFQTFPCMSSELNRSSDFQNCLEKAKIKSIRLSQNDCGKNPPYDEEACKGVAETHYNIIVGRNRKRCVLCKPPGRKPDISISVPSESNDSSTEKALNTMNHLTALLDQLGNSSTASITIGDVKGAIYKLPVKDQTNISFGITQSGDMHILESSSDSGFSRTVQIPKEASVKAVKQNGTFIGVLLFPGIHQDESNSHLFNSEMVGMEMGTEMSNLSKTIDIHYTNVDKKGNVASCRSWDGKGEQIWITDGCVTTEANGSITCQCSHLTFFAILMSPPPGNITSSDFTSMTSITKIGSSLSVLFLAVAVFMHCFVRKGKASQETEILLSLFVAMFTMNLSFLVNESVANTGNFSACVLMAAVMHYSLLATFTWFFIEALHLCLNLWKLPRGIKHYMTKICITGWVTPAVVVIALLASKKYDIRVIYTNDGNLAKMCWISDTAVHQGLNLGYYAIVFIFTLSTFIIIVWQISLFKRTAQKTPGSSSTKKSIFSILGLFLLLGITWAFAFFSYGPLLIPSYYIFTILNSFQGFFLFIYYYNSSKTVEKGGGAAASSSISVTTLNTIQ